MGWIDRLIRKRAAREHEVRATIQMSEEEGSERPDVVSVDTMSKTEHGLAESLPSHHSRGLSEAATEFAMVNRHAALVQAKWRGLVVRKASRSIIDLYDADAI